jgi:acetyltransferase-like isoleucine patch superfamily enzyme
MSTSNVFSKIYARWLKWYCSAMNSYVFKSKKVRIGASVNIQGVVYIENSGKIEIGEHFSGNSGKYWNPIGGDTILRIIAYTPQSIIKIGNNVGISNSTIVCWNRVEIEDNVVIGGGVKIWDTNFHSLNPKTRISGNDIDIKTAPIKICKKAFIGGGSIILKGVTIGNNSVIAAGSVVVKDIPENVIAGGNPCRVIKPLA